jgi:hypothetical protein
LKITTSLWFFDRRILSSKTSTLKARCARTSSERQCNTAIEVKPRALINIRAP